jgi:hypothetical protein
MYKNVRFILKGGGFLALWWLLIGGLLEAILAVMVYGADIISVIGLFLVLYFVVSAVPTFFLAGLVVSLCFRWVHNFWFFLITCNIFIIAVYAVRIFIFKTMEIQYDIFPWNNEVGGGVVAVVIYGTWFWKRNQTPWSRFEKSTPRQFSVMTV